MESQLELQLVEENKAYENLRAGLIEKYRGKWVTIFRGKVVAVGETYDESAAKAREKYGEEPMITRLAAPEEEERYWIVQSSIVTRPLQK